MISIEELIERQKEFDRRHGGQVPWDVKITDANLNTLEFLMICMVGEFGEAANIVKKIIRGDNSLEDVREALSEEIIDILIYLMKLAYQLDINIEETYKTKMRKNEEKFKRYERNTNE